MSVLTAPVGQVVGVPAGLVDAGCNDRLGFSDGELGTLAASIGAGRGTFPNDRTAIFGRTPWWYGSTVQTWQATRRPSGRPSNTTTNKEIAQ